MYALKTTLCVYPLALFATTAALVGCGGFLSDSNDSSRDEVVIFESFRDGNAEIYMMEPDGSNLVNLTTDAGFDSVGGATRDGRRIAFMSNRTGNEEIWIMNADGSNPINLTNNPAKDFDPVVNPVKDEIVFVSDRDGTQELYRMKLDGSGVQRITDFDSCWTPSFSRDGSLIAFARSIPSLNTEVYVMNEQGGGATNLTNMVGFDWSPVFNRDASKILFYSNRDGDFDVYEMNPDGTGVVNLTQTDAVGEANGNYNFENTRIVYHGGANAEIFIANADGSNPVNISNHASTDQNPLFCRIRR
jgi:Tol biopolymer transport system component